MTHQTQILLFKESRFILTKNTFLVTQNPYLEPVKEEQIRFGSTLYHVTLF